MVGLYCSLLFNINVSSSITAQGRALISSASMMFESFIANSVKFGSLDQVLLFINNICKENRKFDDFVFVDNPVSMENCFAKIVDSCGFMWMPNDEELDVIWQVISNLGQRDLNRVYYKNNLYEFCSNSVVSSMIVNIVKKLEEPYFNPVKPPEYIKDDMEDLAEILGEFVFYDKMIIDRIDRNKNMIKSTIMISDTDSCIVSLDAWYRFVLDLIKNEDIKLRRYDPISLFDFIEKDEFGDIVNKKDIAGFEKIEDDEYFDFDNDEIRYRKHAINPFEILPQDYLRWSIVNILAYIIDIFINRYMLQFTKNNHSWAPDKPCKIIMKNEFSFNRVLITDVKKSYASIQKVQEGNLVPESEQLDVKGIAAIAKSSISKSTRDAFKKILLEDILTAPTIDQFKIVEKLCIMEKKIINSLQSGSKEFYKPVTIKAMNTYADPMRQQGIKASYVWNALTEGSGLPNINLDERNAIDVAKVYLNKNTIDNIKDKYPEIYERAVKIMADTEYFKGKIESIAVPENVQVPEWLIDILDYKEIVNNNISGFPYQSVGLTKINDNTIYSNILQI